MTDQINTRQGHRKSRQESKQKKPRKKGFWKKTFLFLAIFGVVASLAGGITAFTMIQSAPSLDPDKLTLSQGSLIYDQSDEFVSQLDSVEKRINVSIQDVPQVVEDAFIAVEDVRFRQHFGVDVRRLFGAVKANLLEGFGAEGASTITQQLVKNLFLNEQKKLTRKVQEQYLAIKLEQQYSKDQILEMYLNQIYLGSGGYGIERASQSYFNKSIEELTLADAALLAGIPRRPSFYDPTKNPEAAESRRNLVLSLMEQHGKITHEQAEEAKAVPIEEQINETRHDSYPYEAFYDQVLSELEEIEGITVKDIYNSGLKVYTTLDVEAQKHVEAVLQTDKYITSYPDNEDFQAGVSLLDTKTGQIKAIGSGLQDTNVQRGFNYATDLRKQPGSTIKPILDYGPAVEYLQWSTGKILVDEPHNYNVGVPIRNVDRSYEGPISMRRALARSRNVTAVKALQEVGVDRAETFAKGLGVPIEYDDNEMPEAFGLGGFRDGISTLHLAGAYAAFGNNGAYTKPYTVRKIVFPDGREINMVPEAKQAMSDYTAYIITDVLKTAVREGTGTNANIPGLPLAGKSGTTNFDDETRKRYGIPVGEVPDVWFAGYTTNYTAAVWTGFSKNGPNNYLRRGDDRRLAQRIFKAVMGEMSKGKETPDFQMPNSVVRVGVERSTGLLPSKYTPKSEIVYELFVRGNEPTRVSEHFISMDAPSNFMAHYAEEANQILLSWNYPAELANNVTFELQVSIDGASPQTLDRMKEMQYIYNTPEPGRTYTFSILAIADDSNVRSESVSASVNVQGDVEEDDLSPPIDDEIGDAPNNSEKPPVEDEQGDEENPDDEEQIVPEEEGTDENEDEDLSIPLQL
ncbi:PBP1A family penicillin-binding protein [bacterium LRH843]|nr:PBP1A family penicillin-binding protein [bacterium LRH843]